VVMGCDPSGCGLLTMMAMSCSAAVNRSLLLGKGNSTLVGNHVNVSAIRAEFFSALYVT
jgi:hypothetical protein